MFQNKWYHGRVWVLIILFGVLGPMGLPILWKSTQFSKPWKQILTVLTLLYTLLILKMTLDAVLTSVRTLSDMGLS